MTFQCESDSSSNQLRMVLGWSQHRRIKRDLTVAYVYYGESVGRHNTITIHGKVARSLRFDVLKRLFLRRLPPIRRVTPHERFPQRGTPWGNRSERKEKWRDMHGGAQRSAIHSESDHEKAPDVENNSPTDIGRFDLQD